MAGKTVKQLYGNGSGQSFMDRVNAAKHSFTGSGLAKVVCKSTTEEMSAPKKKHLEYLVQCTFEQNISIPELANLLIERSQQSNWVIVFKSLITIHHLMNYGNERFFQYLASNNSQLSLSNFTDRTGIQAFDMSKFVRQYSRYVEQKSRSYRDMGFDFCKIKRGKEEGVMRKMSAEKLMKTIPILETQLDSMLDFDANGSEIHHSIVYAAFLLLYKDAIRLFATYNDGIINLIEKYFTMSKKQCKEALDCYKKFTKRMDRLNKFLRLAEDIGFGEQNGLELQPVPPAVLEALETHLNMLEGKKPADDSSGRCTTGSTNNVSHSDSTSFGLTEAEKRKIIEEEKAKLEEYASKKSQNAKKAFSAMPESIPDIPRVSMVNSSSTTATPTNSSNFQKPNQSSALHTKSTVAGSKASDDLVLLDLDPHPEMVQSSSTNFISPEVANIFAVSTTMLGSSNFNTTVSSSHGQQQQQPFGGSSNMGSFQHQSVASSNNFPLSYNTAHSTEINFDKAFGNSTLPSGQQHTMVSSAVTSTANANAAISNSEKIGDSNTGNVTLDDKLASLVGNLDISAASKLQSKPVTSVNWGGSVNSGNTNSITASTSGNKISSTGWMSSTSGFTNSGNSGPIVYGVPQSGQSTAMAPSAFGQYPTPFQPISYAQQPQYPSVVGSYNQYNSAPFQMMQPGLTAGMTHSSQPITTNYSHQIIGQQQPFNPF